MINKVCGFNSLKKYKIKLTKAYKIRISPNHNKKYASTIPKHKSQRDLLKWNEAGLFLVNNKVELAKYVKANIYGKKIVIGMGAGTISTWMRELPKLI